jgi:integrase
MKNSKLPIGVSSVSNRPGLYQFQFTLNGKRYSEYYRAADGLTVKKLNSLLQAEIDGFREKVRTGRYTAALTEKSRFSAACEWFLETKSKLQTLKPATIRLYKYSINNHLNPAFGDLRLEQINSAAITRLFADLVASGNLDNSTIKRISTCLSGIFTALVKSGVLTVNPCKNAEKPRQDEKNPAYLDNLQTPLFVDTLAAVPLDDDMRLVFTLGLRLGLRSGEIRGLSWQNIDFQNNVVHIKQAVNLDADGKMFIGTVKTKRSVRDLPLSDGLRDILSAHREKQQERAAALGSAWQPLDLVCADATGGIITPQAVKRDIGKIKAACPSLPADLHLHSLRHTFVSLLIFAGVDITTIAALIGDTVQVTASTYAHVFKEQKARSMDVIGGIFDNLNVNAPRIESVVFFKP